MEEWNRLITAIWLVLGGSVIALAGQAYASIGLSYFSTIGMERSDRRRRTGNRVSLFGVAVMIVGLITLFGGV